MYWLVSCFASNLSQSYVYLNETSLTYHAGISSASEVAGTDLRVTVEQATKLGLASRLIQHSDLGFYQKRRGLHRRICTDNLHNSSAGNVACFFLTEDVVICMSFYRSYLCVYNLLENSTFSCQ